MAEHVKGKSPTPSCSNCGQELKGEKAVVQGLGSTKFFCKAEPEDNVEDSCLFRWKMRRH